MNIDNSWQELISGNFYKTLYILMRIKEFSEIEKDWKMRFIATHGPQYLINIFLQLKEDFITNAITKQFMHVLLSLID